MSPSNRSFRSSGTLRKTVTDAAGGAPASTTRRTARRVAAAVALACIVAGGLAVHLVLPDTAGSDIVGDALYAVAVYAGVVLVAPGVRPAMAAGLAAGWCVAVELFQLTGIPIQASVAFPPAVLVLGTVFDPRDLFVYPLAVGVAWAIDASVSSRLTRRR